MSTRVLRGSEFRERAGNVFSVASALGRALTTRFKNRQPSESVESTPPSEFGELLQALAELSPSIQSPPPGFGDIADRLRALETFVRKVQDATVARASSMLDEAWPEFNTFGRDGLEALSTIAAEAADAPLVVEPTPAEPPNTKSAVQPPADQLNAAMREIPVVMDNQGRQDDGTVAMIDLSLLGELRQRGHNLSAAENAIREMERHKRLIGEERNTPILSPGGNKTWYMVDRWLVATDLLWKWWRESSIDSKADKKPSNGNDHLGFVADVVRNIFAEKLRYVGFLKELDHDATLRAVVPFANQFTFRRIAEDLFTLGFSEEAKRLLEVRAMLNVSAAIIEFDQIARLIGLRFRGIQASAVEPTNVGKGLAEIRATLLVSCLEDDEGAKLFADADIPMVVEKNPAHLDHLYREVCRLSNIPLPAAEVELVGHDVGSGELIADGGTAPRKKRSTNRGDARAKLIAALSDHHQYAKDSCLHLEPVGVNELARKADKLSNSTASEFFKKEFGGHDKYVSLCLRGDTHALVVALKLLNQEYSPHILFGQKPPSEGTRDNDE